MTDELVSVESILGAPVAAEVPAGWLVLSRDYFSGLTPDRELATFFNGGEPFWEAVANPLLHRIQLTDSLIDRTRRRIRENKSGLELLVGPTGEGKSTALRQAAMTLAMESDCTILWRQQRGAVLDQDVLNFALDSGEQVLIVSDNAQLLLGQLHEFIKSDSIVPASGLQFLLASRDTDWARQWRQLKFRINPVEGWRGKGILVSTKHPFGKISKNDARKIIQSWHALDSGAPTVFCGISDHAAADLLIEKCMGANAEHGALLGGLLSLRYTPEELRAHLVDLLEALSGDATGGDVSLADVVVVLALVDVAGIDGVPSEIMAGFCEIKESNVRSEVATRLGREAVANYSDDLMRSRHPMIAEVIFEIAMSDSSSIEVENCAAKLLEVIAQISGPHTLKDGFGKVFGLGRALYKAVVSPELIARTHQLSIALARKACELRPTVFANHMALSDCLRSEKHAEKALTTVWQPLSERLLDRRYWHDWNKNVRTALNEFAIIASLANHEIEAAVLRLASLSDNYSANRLETNRVSFVLEGLLLHLSRLYVQHRDPVLAAAVSEVHGCIAACFPGELAAADGHLQVAGCKTKVFTTPATFIQCLGRTLDWLAKFESEYLNMRLWKSHIDLVDLRNILTQIQQNDQFEVS